MPIASSETHRTTSESSRRFVAITPADSDLVAPVRALWINTTGWIKVTGIDNDDGTSCEFYVLAGSEFPGWVKRVWATPSGGSAATVAGLL